MTSRGYYLGLHKYIMTFRICHPGLYACITPGTRFEYDSPV